MSGPMLAQPFGNRPANTGAGAAPAPPVVSLPKGGGAIRGIGETFAANPVTGTGSLNVPIAVSPGRSGFGPTLALSYDSGAGNGPFGLGWSLSLPSITRKTDKGLPRYRDARYRDAQESDVFMLGADDLVPAYAKDKDGNWVRDDRGEHVLDEVERDGYAVRRFRPRAEEQFARVERWTHLVTGDVHWRSTTRDNVTTVYGRDDNSRILDPDAAASGGPARVFSWLVCSSYDDRGNAIHYRYTAEDARGVDVGRASERQRTDRSRFANRYLKRIWYGNRQPNRDAHWRATDPAQLTDWMFEVVFDYGEGHYAEQAPDPEGRVLVEATPDPPKGTHWPVRQDAFSSYRPGFELRTYRLCRRVLMFHRFPEELEVEDCLVRSTEFAYAESPVASFLVGVTQSGFVRVPVRGGPGTYLKQSLPTLELEYSGMPDEQALARQPVQEADGGAMPGSAGGLGGEAYRLVDLDGEGGSGLLAELGDAWLYRRNLSANNRVPLDDGERVTARFGPVEVVATRPAVGLTTGGTQLVDLAGDGTLDLVRMDEGAWGFYERAEPTSWVTFRPFASRPNLDPSGPNVRLIDLNGDGHVDLLVTDVNVVTWYPSLAEDGFGPAERVVDARDAERGPRLVLAEAAQSMYLADCSGDGLTDLVRVRNGEVAYWPNLGYGRFGAKIVMDNSPWFDLPDQFDQGRIRLADVDGSGVADILYLARDGLRIYFNQSGNGWSDAVTLPQVAPGGDPASVQVVDLLGNGTACVAWSSPVPGNPRPSLRYVDLVDGRKPHLLVRASNNLGAETRVHYAPSTKFYLDDQLAGTPWVTRLPFPVHVVERVELRDLISRNRFVTSYAYHHGYFDGTEREFRGFAMVEQCDAQPREEQETASVVPPVLTRTWFHTGAYRRGEAISRRLVGEYYGAPGPDEPDYETSVRQFESTLLPDAVLPEGLSAEEVHDAHRALKGRMLRQEIYALDGSGSQADPYTISERSYTVELLQPRGSNRHAVYHTHTREELNHHHERRPGDPRIMHAITLEVDGFGNVLKHVAVAYGRAQAGQGLRPGDGSAQTRMLVTYTENEPTNGIDRPDAYRAPLPADVRTYELTGFEPANGSRFTADDFVERVEGRLTLRFDVEIDHRAPPGAGRQRRLVEQVRTLYRPDALGDPAPLGTLGAMALAGETYRLAFTPRLLHEVYRRRDAGGGEEQLLLPPAQTVGTDGRYRSSEELRASGPFPASPASPWWSRADGDGHWWAPSGTVLYSPDATHDDAAELAFARAHFFLPYRYRDAFGKTVLVDYDRDTLATRNHNLMVTRTRDPLGNVASAEHDYRVLLPRLVVDPNGNRSWAAYDALGLTVARAVAGKPTEQQGDTLAGLTDEDLNLPLGEVRSFVAAPRDRAPALLRSATARLVHDVGRFARCGQPSFTAVIERDTHVSDLPHGAAAGIQLSFSHTDGFGRQLQVKAQAEAGEAPRREPDASVGAGDIRPGALVRDADGDIVRTRTTTRWVGTGRTVYNNKGKPVKRYEPFFSSTHLYEPEPDMTDTGVTPLLCYDPLDRVTATFYPNRTYEKVVFDPWQQATWDANDTVGLDPETDDDVKGFVIRLPPADRGPTWYQQRIGGGLGPAQQDAAAKTLAHAATPTVTHFDVAGRPFVTVADNGTDAAGTPQRHVTSMRLDIEGNQRVVVDADGRVAVTYDYDLLGNRIHQASMEAGEQWLLHDVTGQLIRNWNSRGVERRLRYDDLRRPTEIWVRTAAGGERLAQRTIYGEAQGSANNHRTRAYKVFDGAGVVTNHGFDFKGNLLRASRRLLADHTVLPDWTRSPALSTEQFVSSTWYDALNRPIQLVAPHSDRVGQALPLSVNVVRPGYNEANLLERVDVWLGLAAEPTGLLDPAAAAPAVGVLGADYDARGQRLMVEYKNGVRTRQEYDSHTHRLMRIETTRPAGQGGFGAQLFTDPEVVQDLRYTYDPAGNVTRLADEAIAPILHDGQRVEAVSRFTYDAVYRLVAAEGREHAGQTAFSAAAPGGSYRDHPFVGSAAHPNDPKAVRGWTETYGYDAVGNLRTVTHQAAGGAWTRRYVYSEPSLLEAGRDSNRLTRTVGAGSTETYGYVDTHGDDVNGCVTRINATTLAWDSEERLRTADLGGGGRAWYVYDGSGQRVRKVWRKAPGLVEERIYLGGFELFRRRSGTALTERETLHVLEGQDRIAMVETRTADTAGTDRGPRQLVRYQLRNHLGSSSLELSDRAQVISYEEYHPFGTTALQASRSQMETPKRYRHAGKERDEETGLYYHGARYYAPWLGRYTSCDPAGMVDGLNLYAGNRNNPVRFVDVSGQESSETHIVTPEVRSVLDHYGLKYGEQVDFETTIDGKTVRGRFDFVVIDPRSGDPFFPELKGENADKLHGNQKLYLKVLESKDGARVKLTGKNAASLGFNNLGDKTFKVTGENYFRVFKGSGHKRAFTLKDFSHAIGVISGKEPFKFRFFDRGKWKYFHDRKSFHSFLRSVKGMSTTRTTGRLAGAMAALKGAGAMAETLEVGEQWDESMSMISETFTPLEVEQFLTSRSAREEPEGVFLDIGDNQYYWVPETAELWRINEQPRLGLGSLVGPVYLGQLKSAGLMMSSTYYSAKHGILISPVEGVEGGWEAGVVGTPGFLDKMGERARVLKHDVLEWWSR